ncbi:hypothetical protein AB1Y20_009014 [Prymnesium parvum]|uniref:Uncharacterized protein n=1 Tax=Prymnesium parvum TaxID=97485 RepID=A0AB34JZJ2_PRYPA
MEVVPPPQGGDEQQRTNTLSEDELLDGVEEDWNTAILGPNHGQGAQGEAMPPPPPRAPHELELEQAAATPVMNEAAPRPHIPSPTYTSSSATAEIHQIKSDGGYLQIFYSNTPRADKIALDDQGMIIQAINTSIAQHKDESLFPMIESGSILIKDKWMCAQVTMSSYDQCVKFAEEYGDLPIYDQGDRIAIYGVSRSTSNRHESPLGAQRCYGYRRTVASLPPAQHGGCAPPPPQTHVFQIDYTSG